MDLNLIAFYKVVFFCIVMLVAFTLLFLIGENRKNALAVSAITEALLVICVVFTV